MCGVVVCRCTSVIIAPCASTFTPAACKFRPSIIGFRPVASRIASPSTKQGTSSAVFVYASVTPSAVSCMDCARAFRRISTPFFSSTLRTLSAISRSSRGMNALPPSSMVTLLPNSAYMEANSSPMYPPPTIIRWRGSMSRSSRLVLVYTCLLSLTPSMAGIILVAPVLMKISLP